LRQGQRFVMQHWNAFSLLGAAVLLVGISLSDFAEGQPLVSRTAGVLPPHLCAPACTTRIAGHLAATAASLGSLSNLSLAKPRYTPQVAVMMSWLWITTPLPIAATAILPVFLFPFLGIMSGAQVHLIPRVSKFCELGRTRLSIRIQTTNFVVHGSGQSVVQIMCPTRVVS